MLKEVQQGNYSLNLTYYVYMIYNEEEGKFHMVEEPDRHLSLYLCRLSKMEV